MPVQDVIERGEKGSSWIPYFSQVVYNPISPLILVVVVYEVTVICSFTGL